MDNRHWGCWEASENKIKGSYCNSSCLIYEALVCEADSSGLILIFMPVSCNLYHSPGCILLNYITILKKGYFWKNCFFFRLRRQTLQDLSYVVFLSYVFLLQRPHVPRPTGRHSEQACRCPWGGKGLLYIKKPPKNNNPVISAAQLLSHAEAFTYHYFILLQGVIK